jgi:hypothetical protein
MRTVALITLIALSTAHAEGLEDAANKPHMYRIEYGELVLGTFDNGQPDVVHMGPGLCLDEPAAVAIAAHLEGLKAENASLKESLNAVPPPSTSTWILVGAIVLGVAIGGAAALTLKR